MKKVTGIGGIFFKCNENKKMQNWYYKNLGIKPFPKSACTIFEWRDKDTKHFAHTVFEFSDRKTTTFGGKHQMFMFNFRVENLGQLLIQLKRKGIKQVGKIEEYEYGKFAWITDPEGNKIELWEPKDEIFRKVNGLDKTSKRK